jgi:hypothetical protein
MAREIVVGEDNVSILGAHAHVKELDVLLVEVGVHPRLLVVVIIEPE